MPFVKLMRVGPVETPRPRYMREGDAGFDLCAAVRPGLWYQAPTGLLAAAPLDHVGDDLVLRLLPGASAVIPTGWAIQIPEGYEGQVRGRSGFTAQRVLIALGTVDSNYRGEVCFHLWNQTGAELAVRTGDRLAQIVIAPVAIVAVNEVSELDPTSRGDQGFGSSGARG